MSDWLSSQLAKTGSHAAVNRRVRARYDAAQTSENNRRHWEGADALSAKTANNPVIRKTLRERARYECDSNCYAEGIVETWVAHVVGTGPRLQVMTEDRGFNRAIEDAFQEWAYVGRRDIDGETFADQVALFLRAKTVDGEGFAAFVNNESRLGEVKLDIRAMEAEQVTTPFIQLNYNWVDGIVFDQAWNPKEYHVLRLHPGDLLGYNFAPLEYDRIPASQMMHWFRKRRPGQARGTPEITQALPLFAQLRRFTGATLSAAEIAADFAALLETQVPPDDGAGAYTPFEGVEIEQGMMVNLPAGWKMSQLRAEHPTTTYPEFKREVLNEIARAMSMPYNIAAGNSSGYNYSSGRLDHQTFNKCVRVCRNQLRYRMLDRVLAAWHAEASLIRGYIPKTKDGKLPHTWNWDGMGHVDPTKESSANSTDLSNHTTTLADLCAREGNDWEEVLRQRSKEQKLMRELGLEPPPSAKTPSKQSPAADEDGVDGVDDDVLDEKLAERKAKK